MTTPAWPASLPQALLKDGFSLEAAENLLVSQTSVGPAKIRRRSTSGVEPLAGSMNMTTAQVAAFRSFVKNDIKGGSIAFTFPDPLGGVNVLVRRRAHTISAFGANWRVQLSLEVLP